MTRPGGAISASYRFTDWLTVGGVWTLDPTIQTDYGTAIEPRRWVDSGAPSFALLSGYVGRNVSIMAGPVRVWSQWTWDHVHSTEADRTEYVRMGAMVRASALVPLRSDLNIEFVVRRLLVGRDVVPATDPVRHGAVGGFFIGAGIAVRRTPR